MKKRHMMLWAIFLALVILPSNAFPWGAATHAYIDDHLGKKWDLRNMNEIYGGMAPDLFNYMFDSPHLQDLYLATHYHYFMNVWNVAKLNTGKAFAYGFVSHNDKWGADFTAHHESRTLFKNEGYVITKAKALEQMLYDTFEDLGLGGDQYYDLRIELCHNLVEAGVDILTKRMHPMIGQEIISSAIVRSPEFPFLLVKAYAADFSKYFGGYLKAARFITSAEREFRKTMILYGLSLMQDEEAAIQLISEQMAELAEAFLEAYGIILPPGTDLTPLITSAIKVSMGICTADFKKEIAATINFVEQELFLHRVYY